MEKIRNYTRYAIISLFLLFFSVVSCFPTACGEINSFKSSLDVCIYSGFSNASRDRFMGQLILDPQINATWGNPTEISSEFLDSYDLIVLDGIDLSFDQMDILIGLVSQGKDIFLIPNQNASNFGQLLSKFSILNSNSSPVLIPTESIVMAENASDPYLGGIDFGSCPEIQDFYDISVNSTTHIILQDRSTKIPLIFNNSFNQGHILVWNFVFNVESNNNFGLWLYTPFLLYHSLFLLSEMIPKTFADWQYSPIPQDQENSLYILLIVGANCMGLLWYIVARKRSKAQSITEIQVKNATIPNKTSQAAQKWNKIHFPRQISAFYMNLILVICINLPYTLFVIAIYSKYIQPFPMVNTWTGWIGGILTNVFVILDLGIGSALTKFYSAYRVKSYVKAVKYAQIYVWWWLLITVGQSTVVLFINVLVMPTSYMSYITYFVVLSSITRIPGNFGILGNVMNAEQRFDVHTKWNIILTYLINNIINFISIILCRTYYRTQYRFGEAFGTAIGMYLGGFIAGIVDFLIYIGIFKHLGLSVSNLFRVDFEKENLKEAFSYGSKLTVGQSWMALAGLAESTMISLLVLNYNQELAYYGFTGNLTSIVNVVSSFLGAMLPAISEAHGNHKEKLLEYYLVQGIRYSYSLLFFMLAVLFATGSNILLLAGPQWAGSIKYLNWQLFFCFFWPMAWYADKVFQGTGHAGMNTIVWLVEQGTRLILLLYLLPIYNLMAIYYSYIPGIIGKDIVSLILIRKKISHFRVYWIQTLVAPLLSALCLFGMLELLQLFNHPFNVGYSIALLLGGFVGGYYLFNYLTGFFGGWDSNLLDEYYEGINMVKSTRIIFSSFHKAALLGYQHSSWKDTIVMDLYHTAKAEAEQLTSEKTIPKKI